MYRATTLLLLLRAVCDGFVAPLHTSHRSLATTAPDTHHRPPSLVSRSRLVRYESSLLSGSSTFSTGTTTPPTRRREQHKDVVIIGSGLAGLSAALYLSQIDPTRQVTIYEREPVQTGSDGKNVASFAAAGMLAPQSERLPRGDLLDLCVASRRMFPDFCSLVESLAREAGEEGAAYLPSSDGVANNNELEPWNVGYVSTGGFLAPAFAGDSVATWAPPDESGTATWLDAAQVRELEPYLHPDVIGGWWFPEDFSVDARRLTCSLRAACVAAGVQICSGPQYEITSLDLVERQCKGVWLKSGLYVHAKTVLVANGSWMRNLLPVPIEPHKGQSLSLRMPKDRPPILRRVLFAQDSYIVPKADGRLVIGATVEAGSFDANVTPAGLLHILTFALELVPALKDLPLEETWVGLRPTTPDKGPILGATPWDNLLLAGGYWRNGVLLAPRTGLLLAKQISGQALDADDERFLRAFAWDRFTSPEGGARMAVASRYAASMHPVHRRSSGAGISASVGTELGSYSSARSAQEERSRDRLAMFGDEEDSADLEAAFEKAALMGREDAKLYTLESDESERDDQSATTSSFDGSADAFTVGAVSTKDDENDNDDESADQVEATNNKEETDVALAYEKILANKQNQPTFDLPETELEERPDPGFRIYHVDEDTGEEREVPPYTSPGEFLKMVQSEKAASSPEMAKSTNKTNEESKATATHTDETTFDGYTTIQTAHQSREKELEAMRKARQQNRLDQDAVDESRIGARQSNINGASSETKMEDAVKEKSDESTASATDIQSAYDQIMARKSERQSAPSIDDVDEEREDPGFRIYHVDAETGEEREVPPFTNPAAFLKSIEQEKQAQGKDATKNGTATAEESPDANGSSEGSGDDYNESTFDGYTAIQSANSRSSREEELKAMRESRIKNRIGQSSVDESRIPRMDNAPYGE